MTKLVFLARPYYNPYEPEADYAAHHAVSEDSPNIVHFAGFGDSMTSRNHSEHLCKCLNTGGYDYFAMQHADMAPEEGWIDTSVRELEKHGLDIIHAPARLKNESGVTTTAVCYSDVIWGPNRRITTTELQELPQTFDIETLREIYDPAVQRLLFNTGCMVIKIGDWLDEFPGFSMVDRIVKHDEVRYAVSVSEDYVFAHWCANNGLRAGATKIKTDHYGRKAYSNQEVTGPAADEEYYKALDRLQEMAVA